MIYCYRILCSAFICTLLLPNQHLVKAGYILEAQVLSYASSPHRKYDGFCCGAEESSMCIDHCRNRFMFCLRPAGFDDESDICPTGKSLVTGLISNDSMEFVHGRDLDAGVPNPLVFTGERWPGNMDFYVRVDHVDGASAPQQAVENDSNLVARFVIPITVNPTTDDSSLNPASLLHKDIRHQGPHIGISFELRCAENFYGQDCSHFCFQRDDASGHILCDAEGNMRCMEGYRNLLTNCTECALAPGCSPVGGYCNSTANCICREGYIGDQCSSVFDYCGDPSPCLNGATCISSESLVSNVNFSCVCSGGYAGVQCKQEVNMCSPDPCENGATCLEGEASFECICSSGFGGSKCSVRTRFLGPLIGAVIAIAVLLLIITILSVVVLYVLCQQKSRAKRSRQNSSASRSDGAPSPSSLVISPTTNARTYEDMLDVDSQSVTEAAAAAEARATNTDEKETFDNPIYDQPTPTRMNKSSVTSAGSRAEGDSRLSSIGSLSESLFQAYSPPSRRAMESGNGASSDPSRHSYEDVLKSKFDDTPRFTSSPRGSVQHHGSSEVEKLTVINESYDSLPCSGDQSFNFLKHCGLQASSFPNCTVVDGHRLAGRPIITEVAFSKSRRVGSQPNAYHFGECSDDLGANSCDTLEIDIETTEQ